MGTLDWTIIDKGKKKVEDAVDFLDNPNTQDTFSDILKASLPDVLRYDAGVWVKSFTRRGYLAELKAYTGTEFWAEIDRIPIGI